jgi:hypothetical protein
MEERRSADRVLVGKPKGTRPLERPMCRWEDIKMDLHEIRLVVGGKNWTGLH